jgi:hypothetical protein
MTRAPESAPGKHAQRTFEQLRPPLGRIEASRAAV